MVNADCTERQSITLDDALATAHVFDSHSVANTDRQTIQDAGLYRDMVECTTEYSRTKVTGQNNQCEMQDEDIFPNL